MLSKRAGVWAGANMTVYETIQLARANTVKALRSERAARKCAAQQTKRLTLSSNVFGPGQSEPHGTGFCEQ
jgi:hypothetical protein